MVTYNYQNGVRKYERMWGGEIMHIRNYINGKAVRGEGKNITVYNPANGTVIQVLQQIRQRRRWKRPVMHLKAGLYCQCRIGNGIY